MVDVSSVLYPVGPLPPRVYWVRRLVALGVPLILILIIAVSCAGGGGKPSANSGTGPTTSPSATPTSSSDSVCVPGDLSAQLAVSAPNGIYHLGDSPVFTATMTNVSSSPCQFTSTAASEIWKVYTGADEFWTTAGCPQADTSTTKTLAPQATQQISITWDGKRLEPNCTHGSPAAPGTYVLHATLDGVRAPRVVFYFHTSSG